MTEEMMKQKQKELSKKAIMLIYPDGVVESIDEDVKDVDNQYHKNYYTKMYNSSERLQNILHNFVPYDINDDNVGHSIIDNELVINGVTVLLNNNLGMPEEKKTNGLSELLLMLPSSYSSLEQVEAVEELLNVYPETRVLMSKYDEELGRCKSTYLSYELESIAEQKKEMKKERGY